MRQVAYIYLRNKQWFVHPMSRTVTGLWITTTPVACLGSDESREQKGKVAIQMLNASVHDVPTPPDANSIAFPILAASNTTSWREFMAKATGVQLERENGELTVIPLKKKNDSAVSMRTRAIVLPSNATEEEIGAAIEEAMSRCE